MAAAGTVALAVAAPASAEIVVGLQTGGRALTVFDTATPSSASTLSLDQGAPSLDAIAYQPSTGTLFGTSAERKLYTIDISKTPAVVKSVNDVAFSSSNPLETGAAADFDPATGNLYYVADGLARANDGDPFFNISPAGGATASGGSLRYADATDPRVGGVGFVGGKLFGIDTGPGNDPSLVSIAADGTLTKIGALGTQTQPDVADLAAGPSSGTTYAILGQGAPMVGTLDTTTGKVAALTPVASPAITEFTLQANGALGVPDVSVSESAPVAGVVVNRVRGTTGKVTVKFGTVDGTARSGKDFAGGSGTLTFEAGENAKAIFFTLANDGVASGDKTFNVQLAGPTGGAVLDGAAGRNTVTINDTGVKDAATTLPSGAGPTTGPVSALKAGAKPKLSFGSARTIRLKTFRSASKRRVSFTCSSFCRADGKIKLGSVTIGKGTRTLLRAKGGTAHLDVKLTKLGKARLGAKRTRKVRLAVTVRDTANQVTTKTVTLTLKK